MEKKIPQFTRIITKACALSSTVIMDSSFTFTLTLLQGTPGKPGEIGSKGERVGWKLLVISFH